VTDAISQEWGCKPLPVREGGTMPCASMLETILGAPAMLLPMGQNSDNCHLANEKLRKVNLVKGKNVIRRIIEGFGEPT
jgi:acetylornithine deacetylase/succinyl-diaminopimelate desuccinylase-like protein